jgi:hypothetical protein
MFCIFYHNVKVVGEELGVLPAMDYISAVNLPEELG